MKILPPYRLLAGTFTCWIWCSCSWLCAHHDTVPDYLKRSTFAQAADTERTSSVALAANPPVCQVSLHLVDAESRQPLPGIIRVTDQAGAAVRVSELLNRGTGLDPDHVARQWYVVIESAQITLPQRPVKIEALFGLETELATFELDLTGREKMDVVLPLKRLFDAADRDMRCANTHLHLMHLNRLQADRYLQTVPVGDGLELVFVSHLRRMPDESRYITNQYNRGDLEQLNSPRLKFGFGQEHRHNYGRSGEGFGHVMLLDLHDLIRPVSIGPGLMGSGTDSPPLNHGILQAQKDGGRAIWCHQQRGLEDVPNWLLGTLDAQNIFDGTERRNYETSFYPLLNIGLHVPFSTGTDWFIYDFSRVYVEMTEALTPTTWLAALAKGRSFITNGPLLTWTADGRRPGDVVELETQTSIPIVARAVARQDFVRLELVHNGEVVRSVDSRHVGGHYEAELNVKLRVHEPGWIAVRTDGKATNELGAELFSHSSPIYFVFRGQSIFRRDAAAALLHDMEQSLEKVIAKSQFANDAEAEGVVQVYRDGIAVLRKKIQNDGGSQ